MKPTKALAAVLCAALIFCACGSEIEPPDNVAVSKPVVTDPPPDRAAYPIDVDGISFEISPISVVSLSPSVTEILYELGAGGRLVAISDYCVYPPDVTELPTAGSPASPDFDAISALEPELLIAQSPMAASDLIPLKQEGIAVLELSSPKSYAELCDIYMKLALIFYGSIEYRDTAWDAIEVLDSQMNEAQSLGISKTFVIVEAEAENGLMLSHGGTLCSDMLSVFGTNLWGDSDRFIATESELFELAPEVVFYASGLDESRLKREFPRSLLIEIDLERFERPSARLAELIAECAEKLS